MPKIQLKVDIDKCIGTKACVFEDENVFKFEDGKVYLDQPKPSGTQTQEKDFSDEETKKLVLAAEMCPVNAIIVKDLSNNKFLFEGEVKEEDTKVIEAKYDDAKEFVIDPAGYFLIKVNKDKKQIEIAFCPEPNKIKVKITGYKPIDIYTTVMREKLITRVDHAAYLGRELQKAYICLQKGIDYVQDDELKI
jgi:ferredoxin